MSSTAPEARVFSEQEMATLVADRVQRETAELTTRATTAEAAATTAQNGLDAEMVARKAAEDRATAAEGALETHKRESAEAAEKATKTDARIKQVREVAKHITDETFFTDEARVARVTSMEDDAFTGYLDDLRVAAGNATKGGAPTTVLPPRQTAMVGDTPAGDGANGKATAAGAFLNRRFAAPATKS
jgi:hypothetical protein